jgi:hypothetical protein
LGRRHSAIALACHGVVTYPILDNPVDVVKRVLDIRDGVESPQGGDDVVGNRRCVLGNVLDNPAVQQAAGGGAANAQESVQMAMTRTRSASPATSTALRV